MAPNKLYQGRKPLPSLAQEIIVEILSWLPVKSLLKFRCVCKTWLSLISTSQFIKTHLEKSTNSNNYTHHTLILGTHTEQIEYYTCSLYSLLYEYDTNYINVIEIDFPMRDPVFVLWIVGSCHGLLCLSVDPETLFLYNPSTKKFKKLPFSGTDADLCFFLAYGFGYDELNDDYKVVELCNFTRSGDFIYDTEVKVFSLRNNAWKKLKNHPDGPVSSGSGTFVCGKLHWTTETDDGSLGIVALDMVTEEYCKVVEPKYDDGEVRLSVMESGGCLCVCANYFKIRVDVWVMKEYGIEETWAKLVSVPYPIGRRIRLCQVFLSGNGDFLLNYGPCMMLYNSRYGSLETREIQRNGESLLVAVPAYVESLVPPCFDGLSMEEF